MFSLRLVFQALQDHCLPLPCLHYTPTNPSTPSINNNPPPHIIPVFWGRNHRLPSCSVRQFVFPNAIYASIYRFSMFRITVALGAMFSDQWFSVFNKGRKKNMLSSLVFSYLYKTSLPPSCVRPPSQTPSGLLLAHSPLLSGIHFWSSLSPVAPLSPARLQGHSSLFQVRNQFRCRHVAAHERSDRESRR